MQYKLLTFRSLTYAQKALRALGRYGIFSGITKIPQEFSPGGCSYGLKLRENDINRVFEILKGEKIKYGEVIEMPYRERWGGSV